jgi:predicted CXXCH cytochrome family protein
MQQRTLWVLLLSGLGLVLCGIGLLSVNAPVYAQDVDAAGINLENATYVGVRECSLCHRPVLRDHRFSRHASTLQDVRLTDDAIVADFGQGEDVRTILFPGADEPRPFDANDVAYALGTGMNVQRYLYEVTPQEYMVLPAQWNVNTQSWEPYGDAEQWPSDSYAFGPNCAGCHTTDLHTDEFFWEEDGVQCESCHGPGSLHVEAVSDNADPAVIRASIVLSPDPQVCGQCHSQGVEPETGFPYPSGYRPGQANLLDEEVFMLVPPDDEAHWWSTGHARDKYMQFNESLVSAHASARTDMLESDSADESCLQCHSGDFRWVQDILALDEGDYEVTAPEQVTLESAQFGVTCVNCHEPHGNPDLPTLLRADTYSMCAGCHSNPPEGDSIHYPAREMFEGVQLVENINVSPSAHFTAEEGPRCATCHMPDVPVQQAGVRDSHRWTPILPGTTEELQDSCTGCHTEFVDVEGMRQLVDAIRTSTQARLDAAKAALTDEHPEWVAQALAFVENDGSEGIHNYAYANTLLTNAERALGITAPLDEPNLDALANVSDLPDVQAESEPFTPESFGGGLTLPSIILLGIGALIIGTAVYAFFLRRPR